MKLKSVKSDYRKGQIGRYTNIRFPVQLRADSRSENSDSIPNNIGNHNYKNTGRKLNNTFEKIWDTHQGTYPGNGVLQSAHLTKISSSKERDEHGNKELMRQEMEYMRKLPLKARTDEGNGHE